MQEFTTQVASNIQNDSLSLEVVNKMGECIAVVERFDTEKTLRFELLTSSLDVACVQAILEIAQKELRAFEDGTPLSEAKRDCHIST